MRRKKGYKFSVLSRWRLIPCFTFLLLPESFISSGGENGSCPPVIIPHEEGYYLAEIEPISPEPDSMSLERRPTIIAGLKNYHDKQILHIFMSVESAEVTPIYDPATCWIMYTPQADLPDNRQIVVRVFVVFSDMSFTEYSWVFHSDWDNPDLQVFSFLKNETTGELAPSRVLMNMKKPLDPNFHLDPANWEVFDKQTGNIVQPSSVEKILDWDVILHFSPPLPDPNPYRYGFKLSGKPNGEPKTVGMEEQGDTEPPPAREVQLSLIEKDEAEDTEGH